VESASIRPLTVLPASLRPLYSKTGMVSQTSLSVRERASG
jgi:hypothetical protein